VRIAARLRPAECDKRITASVENCMATTTLPDTNHVPSVPLLRMSNRAHHFGLSYAIRIVEGRRRSLKCMELISPAQRRPL